MDIQHHPLPTLLLDSDGTIHGVNPQAASMTGLPMDTTHAVLERILVAGEKGPPLERFMGELLSRGQARFDGLLNTANGARHTVTAWAWRPVAGENRFWMHLVPAPAPRAPAPPPPTPPPALGHLPAPIRLLVEQPDRAAQLVTVAQSSGVLARELLVALMQLAQQVRHHPDMTGSLAGVTHVATALSTHAQQLAALAGAPDTLQAGPVDVRALLAGTRALLEASLPPEIHVDTSVQEGAPDPWCNALALEQALVALATHAAAVMHLGGHLMLSAHPGTREGTMQIHVRDTGPGMTSSAGTAFPLARELLQRMGGHVALSSAVSAGNCVVVEVPSAPEAAAEEAALPHVLVVEDDEQLRRVTARLLEQSGVRVTAAKDGMEALGLLSSATPFHAVLLDLHLPRADGTRVLDHLSAQKRPLPVVVFTADDDPSVERALLARGVRRVFHKPFRGTELANFIVDLARGN